MKAQFYISLLLVFFTSHALLAQSESTSPRKNHIELNLIWPFVPNIYQVKYNRTLFTSSNGMQGELIISANFRPLSFDEQEGDKSMRAIAVGYRHFWWKGFNTELSIYPEFITIQNNVVDGQNYEGFVLIPEFYAGYKGYFGKSRLFYNIQLGIGQVAYRSNLWPKTEEDQLFFNGNLTVGVSF
ncbi:hypothetical protein BKI52_33225 [marine bacterium AO1-C]|nr:hypothetical protein BKI52_33225 [marine bacterium AO1-C]